jgi:hypothetical protein
MAKDPRGVLGAGTNQLVIGGQAGLSALIGRHVTAEYHIGKWQRQHNRGRLSKISLGGGYLVNTGGDRSLGLSFSVSASRGWFVGASLDGNIFRTRNGANQAFYGKAVSAAEILEGEVAPPKAASPLYDALKEVIERQDTVAGVATEPSA